MPDLLNTARRFPMLLKWKMGNRKWEMVNILKHLGGANRCAENSAFPLRLNFFRATSASLRALLFDIAEHRQTDGKCH